MASQFKFPHPASLDLSIIVVSFNTRTILLDCLRSVYDQMREISFEVFVVDNASSDGSAAAVSEAFPQVHLIQNSVNRGLSPANNQAVHKSKGRYVVLLNSDALLVENCFLKLVRFLDSALEFSIITPQVVDAQDKLCSMRLTEDTPQHALRKILGIYDVEGEHAKMGILETKEVEAIGGSCLMVRRDLFEEIGLMDEGFFLYNEEDDFCRRARAVGRKVCYFPEATIKHLHGKSTHQPEIREKVILETYNSNRYFFSKYYSPFWNFILGAVYKATFLAGLAKCLARRLLGKAAGSADDSASLKLKLLFNKPPPR